MDHSTMPLFRALGAVAIACALVSAGAARAAEPIPGHYKDLYFDAARAGRADLLGGLIKDGFPVDERDSHGYTALILAAYDGHLDTVQFLLVRGADPCAVDEKGDNALMGVAFKGETLIAEALVSRCDVNTTNKSGQTAAMMAVLFGHQDVVRLLAAHGAKLGMRDAFGNTAGSLAHQQGNVEMEALIAQLDPGDRTQAAALGAPK
jgi:ankyrin repeat protein